MKPGKLRIGYEPGTGELVETEPRHMLVTGKTQDSGKTTTLEALLQQLEDLGLTGKMKFYRGDVMKACRGARSLEEVHANVRERLGSIKPNSFPEKVLTELDQYLSEALPALKRVKFAPRLALRKGANVIDLEGLPSSAQQLVVASTADAIMDERTATALIVPEAWKLGRIAWRSVERIAREGAKLRNYVWLDSQQLTGLNMDVARCMSLWLFGQQSMDLEKERVAKMVPGRQVKPDDVQALRVGQFILVAGDLVRRVYVQPAWMEAATARGIATGAVEVREHGRKMVKVVHPPLSHMDMSRDEDRVEVIQEEDPVWKEKYEAEHAARLQLQRELDQVRRDLARLDKAVAAPKSAEAPAPREEPGILLQLAVERPQLDLKVHRPVVQASDGELRGRVALLVHDGFFSQPRDVAAIFLRLVAADTWKALDGAEDRVQPEEGQ